MTRDHVDTAAQAWMTSAAMLAEVQPGGFHRVGAHGTSELVTGAPMPFLNGVISIRREADVEEVAAFAASPRLKAVAWSIQVRNERAADQIASTVAHHGFGQTMALPFMIKELSERDTEVPVADPVVRRVSGAEGDLYQRVMAAGYEGPVEIFAIFSSPAVMDHPSMRAYIAEVDGVPVATSFGVLVDDLVGVFNVAVPPSSRRRGYGRVATAAVLREAYAAGARTAFLHASPLGVPLYQDMGFRIAENWRIFTG
ncbi:GNAT family N-acetyltransferase [Plantactinospora solaniradicis]|uniref:GNAT family N-acetyltransferase n=1 Tax=Plantactinospora solaniradicis TaxID=1723736 RepID=A0ABW1K8K4_9ACTN